ncbi:uncharacterized protein LOC124267447 [Haliotis rubra]|uniref:uncharacterized protein LOC124267447 n=1 Tax=Haliotis rubra TaxID=36100 RepID=UPI001EE562C9|nr:uncharacterized protein LOC124267447 [Haliotis rubra]
MANQCYICEKICVRSAVFKEHIKKHTYEAQYECDKCSKIYFEATHLAVHMVTHAQQAGIQCSICKLKFSCKTDHDRHVKQHGEGDEPKRCEICGQSFPTRSLLKGHVSMVHLGKKGHPCNICGEEFFKLKHLQAHHRDHAVKKVIVCNICGESFGLRSSLRTHMRVHQNDVIYKCVVCPKQVTDMEALKAHVDAHADEECLDCAECGMQLEDCDEVMVHIRKHRGGQLTMTEEEYKSKKRHGCSRDPENREQKERVPVKCSTCQKTFHFVSSLQSHMRIHQTDQLLNCHICHEAWPGVKVLREHIKTHKNDLKKSSEGSCDTADPSTDPTKSSEVGKKKRHRCDICLQKFVSYYGCKTHRLLHTGEKPFRCDVCGQSYVLAGSLKVHMLSHTNERPHVCEICGKSFKQPYILREHQMSHTGKKPFLCDLCGKSFVNKKKLKLHTFVHTRETPFNCKVCGRGFRAFVTRQKHKCEGRTPPQGPSADTPAISSRDVGLVAAARPHTEQVQLTHEYPSSVPTFGDFDYTSVPGPEYNVSTLGYKHSKGQQLYGQDPYQPAHRSMVGQILPVLNRDYMPPVSRFIDPRNAPLPVPAPVPQQPQPPLHWQGSPPGASCGEGLPEEREHCHDNQQFPVGATRINFGWKMSDGDEGTKETPFCYCSAEIMRLGIISIACIATPSDKTDSLPNYEDDIQCPVFSRSEKQKLPLLLLLLLVVVLELVSKPLSSSPGYTYLKLASPVAPSSLAQGVGYPYPTLTLVLARQRWRGVSENEDELDELEDVPSADMSREWMSSADDMLHMAPLCNWPFSLLRSFRALLIVAFVAFLWNSVRSRRVSSRDGCSMYVTARRSSDTQGEINADSLRKAEGRSLALTAGVGPTYYEYLGMLSPSWYRFCWEGSPCEHNELGQLLVASVAGLEVSVEDDLEPHLEVALELLEQDPMMALKEGLAEVPVEVHEEALKGFQLESLEAQLILESDTTVHAAIGFAISVQAEMVLQEGTLDESFRWSSCCVSSPFIMPKSRRKRGQPKDRTKVKDKPVTSQEETCLALLQCSFVQATVSDAALEVSLKVEPGVTDSNRHIFSAFIHGEVKCSDVSTKILPVEVYENCDCGEQMQKQDTVISFTLIASDFKSECNICHDHGNLTSRSCADLESCDKSEMVIPMDTQLKGKGEGHAPPKDIFPEEAFTPGHEATENDLITVRTSLSERPRRSRTKMIYKDFESMSDSESMLDYVASGDGDVVDDVEDREGVGGAAGASMGRHGGGRRRVNTVGERKGKAKSLGGKSYKCKTCGKDKSKLTGKGEKCHSGCKYARCDLCDKRFKSLEMLKKHEKTHSSELTSVCSVCGSSFQSVQHLTRHMKTHKASKEFKCDTCGKSFSDASSLRVHTRVHTGERPYQCDTCGKTYTDSSALRNHRKCHSKQKFKCDSCDKTFSSKMSLRSHQGIHTGHRPFTCTVCGKGCLTNSHLKRHARLHTGVRSHKCDSCPKAFFDLRDLSVHRRVHTGDKPFSCTMCDKTFTMGSSLKKHILLHSELKPFKCDVCDKECVTELQYRCHMKIHSDDKKFICELCGKRFLTASNLRSHDITHKGYKQHKCDQCGKSYRSAWYLQIHRKTHTGENLIQCHSCGDWFIDPSYFKLHQRKYCKGRLEYCSVCGRGFPTNRDLTSHMGIHTGERPFGCETCGKGFAKPEALSEHVKRHTLENCVRCKVCSKPFINTNELRKHEVRHGKVKLRATLPDNLKPGNRDIDMPQTEPDWEPCDSDLEPSTTAEQQLSGDARPMAQSTIADGRPSAFTETTDYNTGHISHAPSVQDTGHISHAPSAHDTGHISHAPSAHDTGHLSHAPSAHDTGHLSHAPSAHDTGHLSHAPAAHDTGHLSHAPSAHDTGHLSHAPTAHDTGHLSHAPSAHDTGTDGDYNEPPSHLKPVDPSMTSSVGGHDGGLYSSSLSSIHQADMMLSRGDHSAMMVNDQGQIVYDGQHYAMCEMQDNS